MTHCRHSDTERYLRHLTITFNVVTKDPNQSIKANMIPGHFEIWAFHGTDRRGWDGIGHARDDFGTIAPKQISRFKVSEGGMLGRGLYSTTSYTKARSFGEYVYLIRFVVRAFKVIKCEDAAAEWRGLEWAGYPGGLDGVYMPNAGRGGITENDEFCFRGKCIERAFLIRRPGWKALGRYGELDKVRQLRAVLERMSEAWMANWRLGFNDCGVRKKQMELHGYA